MSDPHQAPPPSIMSDPHPAPPPPAPPPHPLFKQKSLSSSSSTDSYKDPPPHPLFKHKSLSSSSSDSYRDEVWQRRKGLNQRSKLVQRRSKSVSCLTDDDLDELKGCFELGFGFDSPDLDHKKLSDTLPALEFYYAVNKQYNDTVLKRTSSSSSMASTTTSDCGCCDSPATPPIGSPPTIIEPGDNPQLVKTRLKQWAQVVACSVKQSSSSS